MENEAERPAETAGSTTSQAPATDSGAAAPTPAPETDAPGGNTAADQTAPPKQPTPEEIAELQNQAAKAAEHWESLLRKTADFDNYRKRAARDRQEAVRFANEGILMKLLPVLDNFDMALNAAANAKENAAQSLQTGVNMILSQLRTVLIEAGLEEIDATNKTFDPNFHEAVSQTETDEVAEGQVVQQLRKGYKLRDRLLRPASVVVARKPSE